MHQISRHLPDFECWFSQIYPDSAAMRAFLKYTPFADGTVVAESFRVRSEHYLEQFGALIDYKAEKNHYDLVVQCSDMIVDKKFRKGKTIWVQEGMIDKPTFLTGLVKAFGLPAYVTCNTSLNGSTNICDIYCAASDGYKDYLANYGTDGAKIVVTGIPNYDNQLEFLNNDFPLRDYVMVATSDMRETLRYENRPAFIRKAAKIANGRQLLFKLHPNEKVARAEAEIKKHAPAGTLVFSSGNTSHMIANCSELITQYSTVVYTGIVLGKKVHSYFDLEQLKKLAPVQNGGTSAKNIAEVCRAYANFDGRKEDFLKRFAFETAVEPQRKQYA